MDGINENTAEGYKSILDEEGRFKGYKKNIYCYPPVGTPDGGVYTTAGDLNLFLDAVRKHIILNENMRRCFLALTVSSPIRWNGCLFPDYIRKMDMDSNSICWRKRTCLSASIRTEAMTEWPQNFYIIRRKISL